MQKELTIPKAWGGEKTSRIPSATPGAKVLCDLRISIPREKPGAA